MLDTTKSLMLDINGLALDIFDRQVHINAHQQIDLLTILKQNKK